jgi:hypothetical protein
VQTTPQTAAIRFCNWRNRVSLFGFTIPQQNAVRGDAVVHVHHKIVEMNAALTRIRAALKENIHQHGFATPDTAMDIKALDRR